MTDLVNPNPPRRIKDVDEYGQIVPSSAAEPAQKASLDTVAEKQSTTPIHETLQIKHWKPVSQQSGLNHYSQSTLSVPDQIHWVDQQILIQDIKASLNKTLNKTPTWLQEAKQVADNFQPTWSKLKLCSMCTLNQVPEQYETCTTCNNASFNGAYWADELGRKHPL